MEGHPHRLGTLDEAAGGDVLPAAQHGVELDHPVGDGPARPRVTGGPGLISPTDGRQQAHWQVHTGRATDDMTRSQDDHLWKLAHAERAALAEDLSGLTAGQWRHGTLCRQWDVEEVVAHLTAAASLNRWRWMRSMLGARFRADVHNERRLAEHRSGTPSETLDRFRAIIGSTTAPSGHTPAYLGEVVVHAQDIRRPLGLPRTPAIEALTPVAAFLARRDFAVPSRTAVAGLDLRADDGPFAAGTGPLVTGSTLALVMSMAGRAPYVDELDGPGVPTLRTRIQGTTG